MDVIHAQAASHAVGRFWILSPAAAGGPAMVVDGGENPRSSVGLVYCEECDEHALRDGFGKQREHCEKPERTQVIWRQLVKQGAKDDGHCSVEFDVAQAHLDPDSSSGVMVGRVVMVGTAGLVRLRRARASAR